jgi:hypothetical protein
LRDVGVVIARQVVDSAKTALKCLRRQTQDVNIAACCHATRGLRDVGVVGVGGVGNCSIRACIRHNRTIQHGSVAA